MPLAMSQRGVTSAFKKAFTFTNVFRKNADDKTNATFVEPTKDVCFLQLEKQRRF